ncbi:transmembrane protein 184C isoform X1 [Episyrphus balteatus]|uniref:transmembrane protein 184C isoform X1 n=1 Tax=Episyrphus balteatus TaxID=286459 RepID=UPI00248616BB|nr:transmembrane protein 184C isoform X1 [Episyrphus balteatus]XP_055859278.1 transmembrane protein 184C isoform X1 [Episyrphus balteatus]
MCKLNFRHFCEEWRIWIRPLLIVTYVIFAIIVVPLLIVNSVKDGFTRKDQLILIGGLFVLSAVPISIWHIIQHVIHFTKPVLQKHIIRILWMVPIYALNAWLGLLFPEHSIYVDSLRECYEAYVIYNFMVYLLNYLNLGMDLEATMEHKPQVRHIFPLCCMRPWEMGREFIHNCKHGILQYTVVRPITTFISVICELCGVYGEGTFAGDVAFPYIVLINNISQFVAMYCLVLFYKANKEDLKPMKPIPKFLCIKAVVFFSFFQGVLLNMMVYYGIFQRFIGNASDIGESTNLALMLQNFLICIEMFIAAVAHIYSFPHHPFHVNLPQYWNNPSTNWFSACLSMIDISDMQEDVSEHFGVVSSSLSRRFQGRTAYQPLSRGRRSSSESDYLMAAGIVKTDSDTGNRKSFSNPMVTKNRYGATDNLLQAPSTSSAAPEASSSKHSSNFAININKRDEIKEYSPHYGAPTSGNFLQARKNGGGGGSNTDSNTTTRNDSSSKSDSISMVNSGGGTIKKSDSNNSDWLSTPTDEMLGIDVRGVEKDRIMYNMGNPKA